MYADLPVHWDFPSFSFPQSWSKQERQSFCWINQLGHPYDGRVVAFGEDAICLLSHKQILHDQLFVIPSDGDKPDIFNRDSMVSWCTQCIQEGKPRPTHPMTGADLDDETLMRLGMSAPTYTPTVFEEPAGIMRETIREFRRFGLTWGHISSIVESHAERKWLFPFTAGHFETLKHFVYRVLNTERVERALQMAVEQLYGCDAIAALGVRLGLSREASHAFSYPLLQLFCWLQKDEQLPLNWQEVAVTLPVDAAWFEHVMVLLHPYRPYSSIPSALVSTLLIHGVHDLTVLRDYVERLKGNHVFSIMHTHVLGYLLETGASLPAAFERLANCSHDKMAFAIPLGLSDSEVSSFPIDLLVILCQLQCEHRLPADWKACGFALARQYNQHKTSGTGWMLNDVQRALLSTLIARQEWDVSALATLWRDPILAGRVAATASGSSVF